MKKFIISALELAQKVLSIFAFFYAAHAMGQTQPIKVFRKIDAKSQIEQRQTYINSFVFNGRKVAVSGNSVVLSLSNKTTRGNRTIEAVPYDGTPLGLEKKSEKQQDDKSTPGLICNVHKVTLKAGFNELNIMDPNAVEIWPGRIFKLSTMDEGGYASLTGLQRNDLQLALIASGSSQRSVIGSVSGNTISQGTVTDAVNKIKSNFGTNTFGSLEWGFEKYSYESMEQFSMEAGLGVNAVPINLEVRARAGNGSGSYKNKVVMKFYRKAYDVKVDNDLSQLVSAQNLPADAAIIASVSYGSFGIIEIESDSSYNSIFATLEAALTVTPGVSMEANLSASQRSTLRTFSIKGVFKGVNGNQQLQSYSSLDQLRQAILGNGTLTATTPVVPMAFIVKSLRTGETMMLRSTLTYQDRQCVAIPPSPEDLRVKIKMVAFTCPRVNDGLSNDEDIFGKIEVWNSSDQEKTVWNKTQSQNVKVKESQYPSEDGAYSLDGRASDFGFKIKTDEQSLRNGWVKIKINVKDEEPIVGPYRYETKTITIKYKDLYSIVNSNGTSSGIDNWDAANKMFKISTVEAGNTNKIALWFKVVKD